MKLLWDRSFAVYWLCFVGVCVTLPFTTQIAPLLLAHLGIPRPWVGPTLTLGQSMEIERLVIEGSGIDFEIACVDDNA